MKKFFTVLETAKYCGVSTSCVYGWIRDRDYFIYVKIGGVFRIDRKSVVEFMKG